MTRLCSEPGCGNEHAAKSLCKNHYYRLKRNGHTGLQDRSPKPCSVEGCETVSKSRGMCSRHYQQWKAHGEIRPDLPFDEWFWTQVDASGGPDACHPWTAGTSKGYGYLKREGVGLRAHRVAFILVNGEIPAGLELDHTCHDPVTCAGGDTCPHRACCNVRHLAPKTHRDNCAADRTVLALVNAERQTSKDHCPRNHPYDEANTYITPQGHRHCRACNREKVAARRKAAKATAS